MKNEILPFLNQYWPEISVLVYELFVRLLPTSKNLSLVDLILKLAGKSLELTQKATDKVIPNNQKNTLKSFLVFALLSLSIGANAQLNLNAKTLRLTDNVAAKDTTTNAVDGQLYFNHNTQTLRLHSGGAWGTLGSGGGGGIVSASNGLTNSGGDVQLGGTLTSNTSIAQAGFNTTFSGAGTVTFSPTVSGVAGLNVGSIAGEPTTFANGDIWYNSSISSLRTYLAGATQSIPYISSIANTRVPFGINTGGGLSSDAGFTFNVTNDVLTVGRLVALSTATVPGVNVGSFAGDPSTLINGDHWYNSTTNLMRMRVNGASVTILNGTLTANRIPFASASNGSLSDDAGFTFNATGDVVTVGRLVSLSTATLPGVNVGAFAGDPSTLVNGDIWYNSTLNRFRKRENGVTSSFIINTAPTNFLTKADANGDQITTGISSTTDGSLLMGTGLVSALDRRITADGTPANLGLALFAKGTGSVSAYSDGGFAMFDLAGNDALTFTRTASTWTIGSSTVAATARQLILKPNNKNEASISGDGIQLTAGNNTGATSTGGNVALQVGTGTTTHGKVIVETLNGNGTLAINDGANEQMGVATLVGGTIVVNNTKITANTRVFLSVQTAGGTQGFLRIAARTAGTSFTITSTSGTETSTVAWLLVEPN